MIVLLLPQICTKLQLHRLIAKRLDEEGRAVGVGGTTSSCIFGTGEPALSRANTTSPRSLQPVHPDNGLEPAQDGRDTQSEGERWSGAPGQLRQ